MFMTLVVGPVYYTNVHDISGRASLHYITGRGIPESADGLSVGWFVSQTPSTVLKSS